MLNSSSRITYNDIEVLTIASPIRPVLRSDFSPSILMLPPSPENLTFSTFPSLSSLLSRLKRMVSETPVSSRKVSSAPLILTGIKIRLLINLKGMTAFGY
jgi:hypothetical protein